MKVNEYLKLIDQKLQDAESNTLDALKKYRSEKSKLDAIMKFKSDYIEWMDEYKTKE